MKFDRFNRKFGAGGRNHARDQKVFFLVQRRHRRPLAHTQFAGVDGADFLAGWVVRHGGHCVLGSVTPPLPRPQHVLRQRSRLLPVPGGLGKGRSAAHHIVLRLLRDGYAAALSHTERKVVDSLEGRGLPIFRSSQSALTALNVCLSR